MYSLKRKKPLASSVLYAMAYCSLKNKDFSYKDSYPSKPITAMTANKRTEIEIAAQPFSIVAKCVRNTQERSLFLLLLNSDMSGNPGPLVVSEAVSKTLNYRGVKQPTKLDYLLCSELYFLKPFYKEGLVKQNVIMCFCSVLLYHRACQFAYFYDRFNSLIIKI